MTRRRSRSSARFSVPSPRSGRAGHEWRETGVRRALYIGVFLAVFSELSGITVVMYYGPTILERTGASMSASLNGHAVIGFVLAAFTLLAIPLIDRVGRRRLLLVGVAGACVWRSC